jgi:ribosomal protein L15
LNKNYKEGETVSPGSLLKKSLVDNTKVSIKILGKGKLEKKLKFKKVLMSESVKKQFEGK